MNLFAGRCTFFKCFIYIYMMKIIRDTEYHKFRILRLILLQIFFNSEDQESSPARLTKIFNIT